MPATSELRPAQGITAEAIQRTEQIIRPHIRRTPVAEANGADFGLDSANLTFKLELLQHSGSFKARGAFANLLTREVPSAGVVAASGGNHGAAVAFAARKLGQPARIFVPAISSPEKIARIRGYGADLVITGEGYDDALQASELWARESGALRVHAFDQAETLLGQATLGMELEQQAPALDTVFIAVGGGGLIGGVAAWYGERKKIRIIGVEPETAPTLARALEAKHPVEIRPGKGIASDSLAARRAGEQMFPIAQKYVNRVILVTDKSIRQAQEALWNVLRLAAEPGGVAAFAALLSRQYVPEPDERVGVVICGGNTTAVNFARPAASS